MKPLLDINNSFSDLLCDSIKNTDISSICDETTTFIKNIDETDTTNIEEIICNKTTSPILRKNNYFNFKTKKLKAKESILLLNSSTESNGMQENVMNKTSNDICDISIIDSTPRPQQMSKRWKDSKRLHKTSKKNKLSRTKTTNTLTQLLSGLQDSKINRLVFEKILSFFFLNNFKYS